MTTPRISFGVMFANTAVYAQPEMARLLATEAEEAGFESLWTVEHVVIPKDYQSAYPYSSSGKAPGAEVSDIPDPLIWMAFVAAATTRIKLATGILILPQRNPLVVAKEIATLDKLANGRTIIGVGAGWLEEEFDALGIPFADRGKRLDDHIGALRAAWGEQPASYAGPITSYENCIMLPRPPKGDVPIHIGGHTPVAARRAGRLGDGFFPAKGSPEELKALLVELRTAADTAGRDAAAVELTTGYPRDPKVLEQLIEIGFTRFVLGPPGYDPDGLRAGMEKMAAVIASYS